MKKVFESIANTIKDVSQDVTETMTESSKKNNEALAKSNDKLAEIMKDSGVLASYWLLSLFKVTNPEHTSQFKLVKDPDSNRVKDLLINRIKPVTPYGNLLTLSDADKKFELEGDALKMITNKNYKIALAKLRDKN